MCGVVGLIGTPDAATEAFLGLTTLQHRGQDAAGILSYDKDGFHRVKNIGLVESVFTRENMKNLTGSLAIGHARYSTIGRGELSDVQPLLMSYPYGIGMVHNGNIVNCGELADQLKTQSRRHLLTHSDTETVLNVFAEALEKTLSAAASSESTTSSNSFESSLSFDRICDAVRTVHQRVNGSYSIVTLIAGQGMVAFRDPQGIRPLVWGKRKVDASLAGVLPTHEAHMLTSESVALSFLGYEMVRDIAPGEVIFVDLQGRVHTRVLEKKEQRHCMFEWVYFASPESVIDRAPVYGARIQLGKSLAHLVRERMSQLGVKPDLIVPIPETSRIAAISLAEELGIPYREVLIKNRYIKRTFILDSQEKRQKAVNLKLSPVKSEIQGKSILLIDDSIVRGTTSTKIIELVRRAGATQVFIVSTCPPIQHPCYYGIDFPSRNELIAAGRTNEEIEKSLGADAVIYQTIDGLMSSINRAREIAYPETSSQPLRPCMACMDGEYPTQIDRSATRFASTRSADRDSKVSSA